MAEQATRCGCAGHRVDEVRQASMESIAMRDKSAE